MKSSFAPDPDRGHVFTDRLLNARAAVMRRCSSAHRTIKARPADRQSGARRATFMSARAVLDPDHGFWDAQEALTPASRARLIVAFSVRSGLRDCRVDPPPEAAGPRWCMGALSPRTRNAQVALYQEGDVDYHGRDRCHRHGPEHGCPITSLLRASSKFDGQPPPPPATQRTGADRRARRAATPRTARSA